MPLTPLTTAVRASVTRLGLDAKTDLTTGAVFRMRDELASRNIDATPADIIDALAALDKIRPAPARRAATSTVDTPRNYGGTRNPIIDVRSAPVTPVDFTKLAIAKAFAAADITIYNFAGAGPRSRSCEVYLRNDFSAARDTLNALGFAETHIANENGKRLAHLDPSTGVAIYLVADTAISGGRDI